MTTFDINIKKLNENATIPSYGSEFAAGADLYACMDEPEKPSSSTPDWLSRFRSAMPD